MKERITKLINRAKTNKDARSFIMIMAKNAKSITHARLLKKTKHFETFRYLRKEDSHV